MGAGDLVSVILPVYNATRFIKRSLGSALVQSYSDLEVIVVDDGSTDGTAEIVREFKDSRLSYIYQPNAGQGPARNKGIAQARGQYITFLDADDEYLPGKIEKQVAFLGAHPEYQVCYCNALHFYSERPEYLFRKTAAGWSGNILEKLLQTSFINPNTVMVRREVLKTVGGFSETRYYPEEWDLWLRMALAGFEFGYLDQDLVTVEIREGSNTTMEIQPTLKQHAIEMFERLMPVPIEVDGVVFTKDRTVRQLRLKLAIAYLANGRRREFLNVFRQALGGRSWAYVLGCLLMTMPRGAARRMWRINQLRNSIPATEL